MEIILNLFSAAILTVIQVIGIYPDKSWTGISNLNLRLTNHRPVWVMFVGHIKITEPADDKPDICPHEIGTQLSVQAPKASLINWSPSHLCIPFPLHPNESHCLQLLPLDRGVHLAH